MVKANRSNSPKRKPSVCNRWTSDIDQKATLAAIHLDSLYDQIEFITFKSVLTRQDGAGHCNGHRQTEPSNRPHELATKADQILSNQNESLMLRLDDLQEMMARLMKIVESADKGVGNRKSELQQLDLNIENERQARKGLVSKLTSLNDAQKKMQDVASKVKESENSKRLNASSNADLETTAASLKHDLSSFKKCNDLMMQNVHKQLSDVCEKHLDSIASADMQQRLDNVQNVHEMLTITKEIFEMGKQRNRDLTDKQTKLMEQLLSKKEHRQKVEQLSDSLTKWQHWEQKNRQEQSALKDLTENLVQIQKQLAEVQEDSTLTSLKHQVVEKETTLDQMRNEKFVLESNLMEEDVSERCKEQELNERVSMLDEKMTFLKQKQQDLSSKINEARIRVQSLQQLCTQESDDDQQMWHMLKMSTSMLEMKIQNLKSSIRNETELDQTCNRCNQLSEKGSNMLELLNAHKFRNEIEQRLKERQDELDSILKEINDVNLSANPAKEKLKQDRSLLKQFLYGANSHEDNNVKESLLNRVDRLII